MSTKIVSEETVELFVPGSGTVTGVRAIPDTPSADGLLFAYSPGAGSNVHDPFGVRACRELTAHGYQTLRFQFPYMEARRRRPDRTPILEATWRAVIAETKDDGVKLVVGGRSMGGRIASQVVAQGVPVDGLALFAYPLRPPWNPSRSRDEHLPSVGVPTLFCSGTRDSFATPDDLRQAASMVPHSVTHLLEGADHGFAVLKSSGRTRDEIWEEAIGLLLNWIRAI